MMILQNKKNIVNFLVLLLFGSMIKESERNLCRVGEIIFDR